MKSAEDFCRTQVRAQVWAQAGLKPSEQAREQASEQGRNSLRMLEHVKAVWLLSKLHEANKT